MTGSDHNALQIRKSVKKLIKLLTVLYKLHINVEDRPAYDKIYKDCFGDKSRPK